jgi:hypothetical protein
MSAAAYFMETGAIREHETALHHLYSKTRCARIPNSVSLGGLPFSVFSRLVLFKAPEHHPESNSKPQFTSSSRINTLSSHLIQKERLGTKSSKQISERDLPITLISSKVAERLVRLGKPFPCPYPSST